DADFFRAQAKAYLEKLETLDREVREAVAKIPPERRKVISTHDAFGYFSAEYGIQFIAPLGVSTETEPSFSGVMPALAVTTTALLPADCTSRGRGECASRSAGRRSSSPRWSR
ncbi:metal ABC transporter substrate-binding protein, partial [Bradyrhizobium ottawaense]|uniref:metal ABC transporter substrate-binding protein n=1 Tax=Bradyrhizobium ottawaense TaxID=931866 RepID=UPI0030C70BB9